MRKLADYDRDIYVYYRLKMSKFYYVIPYTIIGYQRKPRWSD